MSVLALGSVKLKKIDMRKKELHLPRVQRHEDPPKTVDK